MGFWLKMVLFLFVLLISPLDLPQAIKLYILADVHSPTTIVTDS